MSVPTSAPAAARPLTPTLKVAGPVSPYVAYLPVRQALLDQVMNILVATGETFASELLAAQSDADYITANQKAQDAGQTTTAMQQAGALTNAEITACVKIQSITKDSMGWARASSKICGYILAYADAVAGFTSTRDVSAYRASLLAEPAMIPYMQTYLPLIESILSGNAGVVTDWRTVIR